MVSAFRYELTVDRNWDCMYRYIMNSSDSAKSFDFLVLGSGIAGLSFALKVANSGSVAVITKKNKAESNTNYAQGGIASVTSEEDSFDLHVQDTIKAGAGLCHEPTVRTIIQEGPSRIKELINLGMQFSERVPPDKPHTTEYDLGKEGGHTKRRILHAKDVTGKQIEKSLLTAISEKPNISVFENHYAIDIITSAKLGIDEENRVHGVYVYDQIEDKVISFSGKIILIATGGCGKVYLYTTNPDIASGDGIAMAWRAGCKVANMEFMQFHPTCLYHPQAKSFLITEAVRGEGGILKLPDGTEFMENYHPLKSLAPRDVVARAIDNEMKKSGSSFVHLDITHKPAKFVMNRFPNIYHTCLSYGLDITKECIPVVPAAHYQCGGIMTSVNGETDISGLYAVGEVTCTGLHGANRLASNSLLEALVCANRASETILSKDLPPLPADIPQWETGKAVHPDEHVVITHNWDEIRRTMWDYVGIVRTNKRLQRARKRILNLLEEIDEYYWDFEISSDLVELRNLSIVAQLIIESALQRHESRGLHYNVDYPDSDESLSQSNTVLQKESH